MRTTLPLLALGGALLLAMGCGAKAVVDGAPLGAGGSPTGTGGNGGSTSTGPFTCDFACGGPVGLCGCAGPCSDGKMRAVGCGGSATTGFTCSCNVDGVMVGTCDSPTLACALPGSCCEAIFGQ
ncbi:MAG: hypothetical protein QM820_57010 [Minicystis sp.]